MRNLSIIIFHRMDRVKDLEYDLEKTREWAIQAEKELYAIKTLTAEKETVVSSELQAKIEDLEKAVDYWYKLQLNTVEELAEAKAKIEEDAEIIAKLIQERDALYESLG